MRQSHYVQQTKTCETYIDTVEKEHTTYPEHNTSHFENVSNITINSDSVTLQKKKTRARNIIKKVVSKIVISLSTKMSRIRV